MKKYFLGIVAIALAITFSAYTAPEKQSTNGQTLKNFTYNNFPNETWINDPSHYTKTASDGQVALDCPGTQYRCGVRAQENGSTGQPVLSGATIYKKDL